MRVKKSRNSNQTKINSKTNKEKKIKLIDAKFKNKEEFRIEKLKIKNRIFEQAISLIEWEVLVLNEEKYNVVKVTLKNRNSEKIYKDSILLITNIKISEFSEAKEIYYIYLLRSKIESVFKFLKDVLGLEKFRVRDFESIKNIIALCFFIGSYFMRYKMN